MSPQENEQELNMKNIEANTMLKMKMNVNPKTNMSTGMKINVNMNLDMNVAVMRRKMQIVGPLVGRKHGAAEAENSRCCCALAAKRLSIMWRCTGSHLVMSTAEAHLLSVSGCKDQ
jgi:hypothetical protein